MQVSLLARSIILGMSRYDAQDCPEELGDSLLT